MDIKEKIEPDYQGFCEHLKEKEDAGCPFDRKELFRLAGIYNTPIPAPEETDI